MSEPSPVETAPSSSPPAALTLSDAKPSVAAIKSDLGPIICPGHSRPVPDIAFTDFTADGYFLISACLDNKAMLRDGLTGDWIGTFIGHKGAVWCARLNREATKAVTGAADFTAKLWDALSGDELLSFPHRHIVKTVTFNSDGTTVITGGQEQKIRVWDVNRNDEPLSVLTGHQSGVSHVIALPSQPSIIVSAANEANIKLWDQRTNTVIHTIETDSQVKGCQLTIDGLTLSLCTANRTVAFYDLSSLSLTPIKSHTMKESVDCVSFSPLSSTCQTQSFVCGSMAELWARHYRFDSGEEIAINKGHHGPVRSLCFAPDGSQYASGSEDGTIRIWNNTLASKSNGNGAGQ